MSDRHLWRQLLTVLAVAVLVTAYACVATYCLAWRACW